MLGIHFSKKYFIPKINRENSIDPINEHPLKYKINDHLERSVEASIYERIEILIMAYEGNTNLNSQLTLSAKVLDKYNECV